MPVECQIGRGQPGVVAGFPLHVRQRGFPAKETGHQAEIHPNAGSDVRQMRDADVALGIRAPGGETEIMLPGQDRNIVQERRHPRHLTTSCSSL